MSYVQVLFNGGSVAVNCSYCGASLEDERERAVASTKTGVKYFCKATEESRQNSCYNQWRMHHH